jgi:hypothetical protein
MKSRKRSSLTLSAILTFVMLSVAIGPFPTTAFANPTGITSLAGIVSSSGNYSLTANIVVSSGPTGGASTYITGTFSGTLEGNGFTISGLSAPLFDVVSGSISNINLATTAGGITSSASNGNTGVLAGEFLTGGSITRVKVSGAISVSNGESTGGLIGQANNEVVISNSSSAVNISDSGTVQTGGLVGWLSAGAKITGSTSSGNISTSPGGDGTGGLVGYMGYSAIGGIRGNAIIENSSASGAVSSTSGSVGGLIGHVDGQHRLNDTDPGCVVTNSSASGSVTVSAGENVGGLIGQATDIVIISNVSSSGPVIALNSDLVGGLIGYSNVVVTNSQATGNVSGRDKVGGLIGSSDGTTTNSRASGTVVGTSDFGVLIGHGALLTGDNPTTTGAALLNTGQTPDVWGQSPNINAGNPYILALIDRGFYVDTTPPAAAPAAPTEAEVKAAAAPTEAEVKAAAARAAAKREAEVKAARADISNKLAKSEKLTVDSFKQAEIAGITADNFAEVQAELLALSAESRADITQVLKVARKYEVVGKIASEQLTRLPMNVFVEVGLIPADSKYKTSLIIAVRRASTTERDSFAEIQKIIAAETAVIKNRQDRLAALKARNKSK